MLLDTRESVILGNLRDINAISEPAMDMYSRRSIVLGLLHAGWTAYELQQYHSCVEPDTVLTPLDHAKLLFGYIPYPEEICHPPDVQGIIMRNILPAGGVILTFELYVAATWNLIKVIMRRLTRDKLIIEMPLVTEERLNIIPELTSLEGNPSTNNEVYINGPVAQAAHGDYVSTKFQHKYKELPQNQHQSQDNTTHQEEKAGFSLLSNEDQGQEDNRWHCNENRQNVVMFYRNSTLFSRSLIKRNDRYKEYGVSSHILRNNLCFSCLSRSNLQEENRISYYSSRFQDAFITGSGRDIENSNSSKNATCIFGNQRQDSQTDEEDAWLENQACLKVIHECIKCEYLPPYSVDQLFVTFEEGMVPLIKQKNILMALYRIAVQKRANDWGLKLRKRSRKLFCARLFRRHFPPTKLQGGRKRYFDAVEYLPQNEKRNCSKTKVKGVVKRDVTNNGIAEVHGDIN